MGGGGPGVYQIFDWDPWSHSFQLPLSIISLALAEGHNTIKAFSPGLMIWAGHFQNPFSTQASDRSSHFQVPFTQPRPDPEMPVEVEPYFFSEMRPQTIKPHYPQ